MMLTVTPSARMATASTSTATTIDEEIANGFAASVAYAILYLTSSSVIHLLTPRPYLPLPPPIAPTGSQSTPGVVPSSSIVLSLMTTSAWLAT